MNKKEFESLVSSLIDCVDNTHLDCTSVSEEEMNKLKAEVVTEHDRLVACVAELESIVETFKALARQQQQPIFIRAETGLRLCPHTRIIQITSGFRCSDCGQFIPFGTATPQWVLSHTVEGPCDHSVGVSKDGFCKKCGLKI